MAEDLIAHGEVREGYLGITVRDLPAREGAAEDSSGGVQVSEVDPGSPAARAGVQRGDQVEAVNGEGVQSAEEFRFRIRDLDIGAAVRLELRRGARRLEVSLTAVELSPAQVAELVEKRVGLLLGEQKVQGTAVLVVRRVAHGSPAAEAGLEPGDLVREVNSAEVSTVAEFQRAAARARRGGQLVVLVQRGYAAERIAFELD